MYEPSLQELQYECLDASDPESLRHVNGLFWHELLQPKMVASAIKILDDKQRGDKEEEVFSRILEDPEQFIAQVKNAPEIIANLNSGLTRFGDSITVLSALCLLYSTCVFPSHVLTLQNGFIVDETSSKNLYEKALTPDNPYLTFLQKHCFPLISQNKADIAWIHGPICISTFAMAMKARKINPDIKIFVTEHSSEYYSLLKITEYLKTNRQLFKVIDGIVLDMFDETAQSVRSALSAGQPLSTVNNLLYIDRNTDNIQQTPFTKNRHLVFKKQLDIRPRSFPVGTPDVIDPSELVNAKLFPEKICPWRKCSFCGINARYAVSPDEYWTGDSMKTKIEVIESLAQEGRRYWWFNDEAVLPEDLLDFAHGILERGIEIKFAARSRFENNTDIDKHACVQWNKETCRVLKSAGLRDIRLGLESGCPRVLKIMNKFPAEFALSEAEEIIKNFVEAGVAVHTPIIFGVGNESDSDREQTVAFLEKQCRLHGEMFSFNVNIFHLDIASDFYRHPDRFGLAGIKLPSPDEYLLSNTALRWKVDGEWIDMDALKSKQIRVMTDLLFGGHDNGFVLPQIWYRLYENNRRSLVI